MTGQSPVGRAVPRFEDDRLTTGRGEFVDDVVLPNMAHGCVVRSPHAHAIVRSIDISQAVSAPGVLTVLTHKDWNASGFADLPVPTGLSRRDGKPMFRPTYPALVKDRVRWVGDYVAFVVAETRALAMDAAELVSVDYEPLSAVTSARKALAESTPLVWDDCPDNVCFVVQEGNAAATASALTRAAHIVKGTFPISRVTAVTMEPRGSIGQFDAKDGRYTIYTTLQRAHPFRKELASVLKVPESQIRVIARDIGGSFGMKSPVYNEVALVLLASKMIGRPVKWTSTRSEGFLSDAQGRDNYVEAELGLDKDGSFLALRVKSVANIGAYLQSGMPSFTANFGSLAGVYRTPTLHLDVTGVLTNTHPIRPYRGNGRPEAAYVIERMVDLAADQLGINPVELRRRNYIPSSAMPFKTGLTFTYDCGEFEKTMDLALRQIDFESFAARRKSSLARGKLRGIGISNTIERAAVPSAETAEIHFDASGIVTLIVGTVTQGQGHETIYKQLLWDHLGIEPQSVQFVQGDTDKVRSGEGTGSSRSASIGGSAVLRAAEKIIQEAQVAASELFGVPVASVSVKNNVMSCEGEGKRISVVDIAKRRSLSAVAEYIATSDNFPNGSHACELEIDIETGQVEIVRYSVVDDVGVVLNSLIVDGQVVGGIAQGAGQILMEQIVFDETGQLLTGSLMDYAIPRADSMVNVDLDFYPVPTRTNPLGVKGAGEAGTVGGMPAIANALADALSAIGVNNVQMPATPEYLWKTIKARGLDDLIGFPPSNAKHAEVL